MADKPMPEKPVLQSERAYARRPRHLDEEAARDRAEAQTLLRRQLLHERQDAMGKRRKPGGPPLQQESGEGSREYQAPEVAATECAEPPGDMEDQAISADLLRRALEQERLRWSDGES